MSAPRVLFSLVCPALFVGTWSCFATCTAAAPPAPAATRAGEGGDEAGNLFQQAMDAYLGLTKEIDLPKAFKLFRQAADRDHAAAAGWAGKMLAQGLGTDKDEAEGLKQIKKALPAVEKSAKKGDADAETLLGVLLIGGLGTEADEKKSGECFTRAAGKGGVAATYYLGLLYAKGRGVGKDDAKAFKQFVRAAEKGVVTS